MFFYRSFLPFSCYFCIIDRTFRTQCQKWFFYVQNRTGNTWYRSNRSQMFSKMGVLKILQTSQENTCVGVFFKRVAGLRLCNIIKKRLQHRCFAVKFAKFLRTSFLTEHLMWLLLVIISLTPDFLPWVNRHFRLTQRVTFLEQPITYGFIETLVTKFFRLS